MPVIREKNPSGEKEAVSSARSIESECQQLEIGVQESGMVLEQSHGDEQISVEKERATEARHDASTAEAIAGGSADRRFCGPRLFS
jgi:hypothetical protein